MYSIGKKLAVVIAVFALLGAPFGAVCLWLYMLLSEALVGWHAFLSALEGASLLPIMALFSYVVGFIPAVFAGCIFSMWYVWQADLPPRWQMMVAGLVSGAGVFLVLLLYVHSAQASHLSELKGLMPFFVIGPGAGVLCALVVWLFQSEV